MGLKVTRDPGYPGLCRRLASGQGANMMAGLTEVRQDSLADKAGGTR